MHYYKSNNEIMQYCIVSNDIALIMHYHALLKRSVLYIPKYNNTSTEIKIMKITQQFSHVQNINMLHL